MKQYAFFDFISVSVNARSLYLELKQILLPRFGFVLQIMGMDTVEHGVSHSINIYTIF